MDGEPVLLDGIGYGNLLAALGNYGSGISDLASHLSVERSAVEDELNHLLVLLLYYSLLQELCILDFSAVIAQELTLARTVLHPVAEFVGGGIARPLLLLLQLGLEAFEVHCISIFCGNEFGQVDREAEGVIESEGIHAANDFRIC